MAKEIIKYENVMKSSPVIKIAGREYVIMPYVADAHIPTQLVDFVQRHPDRDDVNHMLQQSAERILQDIVGYLRDAIAVTIVKSEEQIDENCIDFDIFLPVLMPLDTKERWNGDIMETENRIKEEYIERSRSGKPYIFKIAEAKK